MSSFTSSGNETASPEKSDFIYQPQNVQSVFCVKGISFIQSVLVEAIDVPPLVENETSYNFVALIKNGLLQETKIINNKTDNNVKMCFFINYSR